MKSNAVILEGPRKLALVDVPLVDPGKDDLVVDIKYSGISTGTEKLFWSGDMPPFPGMGYPLVPGYEAAGEIVEAPAGSGFKVGEHVFVPGANCYDGAFGLFGGSASRLITAPERVSRIDAGLGAQGALLALAATARHAMAGQGKSVPDLIVGHGVLGRLLARLTVAAGAPAPTVWEIDETRRSGAVGYQVIAPDDDPRRDYQCIYDASGNGGEFRLPACLHERGPFPHRCRMERGRFDRDARFGGKRRVVVRRTYHTQTDSQPCCRCLRTGIYRFRVP